MSNNDINSNTALNTHLYKFKLSNTETKVIIPLVRPINYGRIVLIDSVSESLRALNHTNNLFLFQAGDTLYLHLSNHREGALFTGKDAGKYNCIYRISNRSELNIKGFNTYAKIKDWDDAYLSLIHQRDSLYVEQTNILNHYKDKFDSKIYDLINLDCWADCNEKVVGFCYTAFAVHSKDQYQAAKNLFFKNYANYKEIAFTNTDIQTQSYKYGDFLFLKENAYVIIMKSTVEKSYFSSFKFSDINDAINLHYHNGTLKDKIRLLAYYNIARSRQGDFVNYIDETINQMGNNTFKNALIQFKEANTAGTNAYHFHLPDNKGAIYSLSDFKGKILVIDFWFTGCKACQIMAASLKPIISSYKKNPNIAFVTISIDRNRVLWLKSIEEEKYCLKDEVNLLEGLNGQSNLVKHYNIESYPSLLVISKSGKIISVSPPDPRNNQLAFMMLLNMNL